MRGSKNRHHASAESALHREVYDSADKLAVACLCGVGALILGWTFATKTDGWLLGVPIMLLGAWTIGAAGWRLLLISSPTIVLDATGIFDRRVLREVIPWTIVDLVTPVRGRYGVAGSRLLIQDRRLDALPLGPIRRALRLLGKLLGSPSGLAISAVGTQLSGTELHDLCLAYSRLHKMQDEPANV
jgi:hypothetical protein